MPVAQPTVVEAEQAIAVYGPDCDYHLDRIVRRSGLPLELLRYAKARMDAARWEEVAANLRAQNERLKRRLDLCLERTARTQ